MHNKVNDKLRKQGLNNNLILVLMKFVEDIDNT